ncbi:hypothetical protein DFP72DRAFT_856365 [Ephemerocybe angulata]|uniref:Uncharacterized protein n=1 Tax=Ephemerocybe angulata TaxID=980116 RepID=A0A8H6LYU4_9AGAR|nr:hypothetical protein DFP72DRAFT_856365 [Tulosesus angulatus]
MNSPANFQVRYLGGSTPTLTIQLKISISIPPQQATPNPQERPSEAESPQPTSEENDNAGATVQNHVLGQNDRLESDRHNSCHVITLPPGNSPGGSEGDVETSSSEHDIPNYTVDVLIPIATEDGAGDPLADSDSTATVMKIPLNPPVPPTDLWGGRSCSDFRQRSTWDDTAVLDDGTGGQVTSLSASVLGSPDHGTALPRVDRPSGSGEEFHDANTGTPDAIDVSDPSAALKSEFENKGVSKARTEGCSSDELFREFVRRRWDRWVPGGPQVPSTYLYGQGALTISCVIHREGCEKTNLTTIAHAFIGFSVAVDNLQATFNTHSPWRPRLRDHNCWTKTKVPAITSLFPCVGNRYRLPDLAIVLHDSTLVCGGNTLD